MTPLHHAARKGHVAVCQLILKHIEKIHPENEFGQTIVEKKSSKRRVLKFKFHPITIKSRAKSQEISWRRV